MTAPVLADPKTRASLSMWHATCTNTIETPILTKALAQAIGEAIQSPNVVTMARLYRELEFAGEHIAAVECPFDGDVEVEWSNRYLGSASCPLCGGLIEVEVD